MRVTFEPSFENWRTRARALVQQRVPPEAVVWDDGTASQRSLFEAALPPAEAAGERRASPTRVPATFVEAARRVAVHRDADRWALLYRLLWRLEREGASLLEDHTDADVRRFEDLRAAVRRDEHKCHAFVRFNAVPDAEAPMGVRYVAWYRPDHPILTLVAPFFARRFAAMRWSLWTPEASAHWDGREVRYGAGCDASAAPSPDAMGELWKTYYASVFNPARLKLRAMHQELPRRFLKHLPEAPLVRELVQEAPRRLQTFLKAQWRS